MAAINKVILIGGTSKTVDIVRVLEKMEDIILSTSMESHREFQTMPKFPELFSYENLTLIPTRPFSYYRIRSIRKGLLMITQFVRVDEEGLELIIHEIWNRVVDEHPISKQGPKKRLNFFTADRCDDNRGRSWNRKAS